MIFGSQADSVQLKIVRQIKSIGAQRTTVAPLHNLLFSTGSTVLNSYSGVFRSTGVAMLIQPPFQLFKVSIIARFRINPQGTGFFNRNRHSGALLG